MDRLNDTDPGRIGPYRLIARLGGGGMGQVYLAESAGGRRLAVKVIRADHATSPEFRERFRREVAAAGKVNGFYTAPVVDADPDGDPPWLATAYIDAPSLGAAITARGPMDAADVYRLAAGLAEALQAIHAQGLIHRDLKPDNVLLAADGPRVIDFGIARETAHPALTTGLLGTPAYMAPEQVVGDPVSAATDVFALGGILVYAATGRSPFDATVDDGVGAVGVLHRVITEPPDLAGLPVDLTPLVAACLAKRPADRPSVASILAAAGGFTDGTMVVGSPPAPPTVELPPPPPTAPTSVVASSAVPPAVAPPPHVAPMPPTNRPDSAPGTARHRGRLFLVGIAVLIAVGAYIIWPQLGRATKGSASPSAPSTSRSSPPHASTPNPTPTSTASPAGMSASPRASSSPATFTPVLAATVTGHPGGTYWITFSPDGATLASGGADHVIRRWDTASHTGQVFATQTDAVYSITYAPGGETLASGGRDGTVRLWDTGTRRVTATLPGQHGKVFALAFNPAGTMLASGSDDGTIRLWDVAARTSSDLSVKDSGSVTAAAFSPDGATLAVGSRDGMVRLWDTATRRLNATVRDGYSPVEALAFDRAGTTLAAGHDDGGIQLWDVATKKLTATLRASGAVIYSVAFSSGATLAAAGDDGIIRLWDITARRTTYTFPRSSPNVNVVAFSPDGRTLASCGNDGKIRFWRISA